MQKIDTEEKSVKIHWLYPNIYPDKEPLDFIEITLSHVRAADSIRIEFDGERNGWVIRMDKTKYIASMSMSEVLEDKVEVAFIPAWHEGESA